MASDLKDRYPGLRPFGIDEKDVFYGRDVEARELTDLVRAERIVVLFSKSGLGKSSLLNAKVCPQLLSIGFWPILVRFQPQTDSVLEKANFNPVEVVIDRLRTEYDLAYQNLAKQINTWRSEAIVQPEQATVETASVHSNGRSQPDEDRHKRLLDAIDAGEKSMATAMMDGATYVPAQPILFNAQAPKLWEYVKTHQFPNRAVPVFVFDQFEEFFNFPIANQLLFAKQLAELLHDQLPTRVMNWLLDIPRTERLPEMVAWGNQPTAKCLLSIRSDRLYEIDTIRQDIPLILRNSYRLNPLHDEQAREAIDKPAQADGTYRTPKFRFSEAIREKIIGDLSNKDCEIESSQLQIVCNHFENYVFEHYGEKNPANRDLIVIDRIDDSHTIKRILNRFYRTQLRTLGSPEDIELARQILEKEMVINHHRVGLAEFRMVELMKGRIDLIEKLEAARLIRAQETHLGKTYELSHDTLIEPVEKVRQLVELIRQREARERERSREREIQLEQQKKAEIERQRLLAEQRRLEAERQEKNRQFLAQQEELIEEQRQRQQLKRLTIGLIATGIVALVASFYTLYSLIHNKRLLIIANSDWASDAYDSGNQRMAYRLWASNDTLMPAAVWWIKDSLDDKLSDRILAPFAGASVQTDPADPALRYVASIFQDHSVEVWEKKSDDATPDSTYRKIDVPDSLSLLSAAQLQVRATNLIVSSDDGTLQVVDLTKMRWKTFVDKAYNQVTTQINLWGKDRALIKNNTTFHAVRTVLASPKGRWLAVLDSSNQAHLYKLNRQGDSLFANKAFQAITQKRLNSPEFSLDSLAFSASEEFLLVKYPGTNQYDLLDLRTEQPPAHYVNTVYAQFSPSGKYITTLSSTGTLAVHDLLTKETSYSGSVWRTGRRDQLAELIFTDDESVLLIVTKQQKARQTTGASLYDLSRIHVTQPSPARVVIAQNVSMYQPFVRARHILVTSGVPASTYNYNMEAGTKQPFPFSNYIVLETGKTSMVFRDSTSATHNRVYWYDVLSGQTPTEITPFLSKQQPRFAFYAPPNGNDQRLIQATDSTLTLFNVSSFAKSGACLYPDQAGKKVRNRYVPSTLHVSGALVKIKNEAGEVLSFFVDSERNKSDYLVRHIYPYLTQKDLIAAGLSN